MKLFSVVSAFIVLSLSNIAAAQGWYWQDEVTYISFDCPTMQDSTPTTPAKGGWMIMKIVANDPYGNPQVKFVREFWVGSFASCDEQAAVLNANRSIIRQPQLLAWCSEKTSWLTRFAINQRGELRLAGRTYYGDYKRCLQAANTTNKPLAQPTIISPSPNP